MIVGNQRKQPINFITYSVNLLKHIKKGPLDESIEYFHLLMVNEEGEVNYKKSTIHMPS